MKPTLLFYTKVKAEAPTTYYSSYSLMGSKTKLKLETSYLRYLERFISSMEKDLYMEEDDPRVK